jgi:glucosamine 6-phosphate synthetase-like amidotransferase/phosphosugar isomerase protein
MADPSADWLRWGPISRRVRRSDGPLLGRDSLTIPAGIPEFSPIAAIVTCQLFSYHLALAAGRDPEAPPNLRKVTLTR